MILATTNEIADKKIMDVKGLFQGSAVKSKHVGRDIGAGLQTLVGGEIQGYSDLMKKARDIALNRMVNEAEMLQANAIVDIRYLTSQVMNTASEVIAYGTAVVVE
ncbi:YbjQ family protein [Lentibacillus sp. N15]|uniref:YbjQ family protein n=1 Tax=Lentibacillus songyuanensis TaxID=3136161 RepID=UPI0031BB20B4